MINTSLIGILLPPPSKVLEMLLHQKLSTFQGFYQFTMSCALFFCCCSFRVCTFFHTFLDFIVVVILVLCRVSNRTWTRTVNSNEPFHFGEPEPNLNQQNFTSVNLNRTWTLKIVLKWTQIEPEPLTKVRIFFSISGYRWRWYTHNKSSGDHQQHQQFLLFFSRRNE